MNNFNFPNNNTEKTDPNNNSTINNIQDMLGNSDLSSLLSQVPPDIMQNLGNFLNNPNKTNSQDTDNSSNIPNINVNDLSSLINNINQESTSKQDSTAPNMDFSNIDMKTIMKMTSALSKLNTGDSRSNLLKSLKPFLRDSRKAKVDQYSNLLNMTKIADVLKKDNKENTDT